MSMISAQIDKLRELAGDGSMEWVTGPIRASVLRDAADTIWELRDDLQRANVSVQDAEHDESMAWDRVRKAEAENAKLRAEVEALKRDEWSAGFNAGCDAVNAAIEEGKAYYEVENAKLRELVQEAVDAASLKDMRDWRYGKRLAFLREARVLGVEVDE